MYRDLDVATWPEDNSPAEHPIIGALLEDGFDEFIAWLDAWSASTHGAGMAHTLAGRYEAGSLDKVTLGLFHNLYRDDYDRFGYDI